MSPGQHILILELITAALEGRKPRLSIIDTFNLQVLEIQARLG